MNRTLKTLILTAFLITAAMLHAEPRPFVAIPATPQHPRNDSASIVELADGRLLMVWIEFIGSELGGNDEAPSHLAVATSRDGGATWEDRRVVVEPQAGERNVYNPAMLRLTNGRILLCYHAYNQLDWGKPLQSTGFVLTFDGTGHNPTPPRKIWDHQPYGPANNNLIRLSTGRLIRGLEVSPIRGGPVESGAWMSDDEGETWRPSKNRVHLPLRGVMEAHPAELRSGELVMTFRTDLGAVFLSRSADHGLTWSDPQTTGLSAPESMPVLVALPSTGDLALIWNHSAYSPSYNHYGKRTPLTCAISSDGGRTWGHLQDIETAPAFEFSNPSCNFFGKSKAIITYFACPMVDPNGRGVFGRQGMDLKALVVDEAWFYR